MRVEIRHDFFISLIHGVIYNIFFLQFSSLGIPIAQRVVLPPENTQTIGYDFLYSIS